ncbi:uncharacterized protein LOC115632626 [Scaptodrosophila lebanonensis]|uniref:Uncharacterized protein LOC115632626 n=1 Tax=Drosophila lebanonensis TaxID=7225 RepID=A0A6J2UCC4_DROLE|nr:uncharacterized protein LOC115632626 [Scaptodrosophila lebanonensis]
MQHLLLFLLLNPSALCRPSLPKLLIDSAPSVVSYQGSSQTRTRFVIAPMGRSLGYVEPTNVNRTFHTHPAQQRVDVDVSGYEFLNLSPVYVHH